MPVAAKPKKKGKRSVPEGIAHINTSFNNTVITITDPQGNAITWASAALCGYTGARKSTPFAAQEAAQKAAQAALAAGMKSLQVKVKGPGAGRESAARALQAAGLKVTSIQDVTPVPYNGCRPPKKRRV